MPFSLLMLAIEVLFAVHAVRTGKPFFWIYILIFVPGIGCLVYFLAVILPELANKERRAAVAAALDKKMNPDKEYKILLDRVSFTPTADNKIALAGEMMKRGDLDGAVDLYESALAPPFDGDPAILLPLANCRFLRGEPSEAMTALETFRAANPEMRSHQYELLRARCLEALGRLDEALEDYRLMLPTALGEEARARYALLLDTAGRRAEAVELFKDLLDSVVRGDRHYQTTQREWADLAKRCLADTGEG